MDQSFTSKEVPEKEEKNGFQAEEIISQISWMQRKIAELTVKTNDLVRQLAKSDTDWISVRKASEMFDVSILTIHSRIRKGTLNSRYIGSKRYVRKSELENLDENASQYSIWQRRH